MMQVFRDFDLGYRCDYDMLSVYDDYDMLSVYDGYDRNAPLLVRFCGDEAFPISSSSSQLYMVSSTFFRQIIFFKTCCQGFTFLGLRGHQNLSDQDIYVLSRCTLWSYMDYRSRPLN